MSVKLIIKSCCSGATLNVSRNTIWTLRMCQKHQHSFSAYDCRQMVIGFALRSYYWKHVYKPRSWLQHYTSIDWFILHYICIASLEGQSGRSHFQIAHYYSSKNSHARTHAKSEDLKVNVMKVGGGKYAYWVYLHRRVLADSNLWEQPSSKYIRRFSGRQKKRGRWRQRKKSHAPPLTPSSLYFLLYHYSCLLGSLCYVSYQLPYRHHRCSFQTMCFNALPQKMAPVFQEAARYCKAHNKVTWRMLQNIQLC